jgi:Uma2 family endonuclease
VLLLDQTITIPAGARDLVGFRRWAKSEEFPETGHISFLDGEIFVDMSPQEIQNHDGIKGEVTSRLITFNRRRKMGRFFTDRTLLSNEEGNLSHEPDGTFALWTTLESERVRLVSREGEEGPYLELFGSPDWVMEIVSKSSVRKDTKVLRELYYRAGIGEYWLIDPRGDELRFEILVAGKQGYVAAESKKGWQRSRVFGRFFRLRRRRGRMNLWEYTWEMKSRV